MGVRPPAWCRKERGPLFMGRAGSGCESRCTVSHKDALSPTCPVNSRALAGGAGRSLFSPAVRLGDPRQVLYLSEPHYPSLSVGSTPCHSNCGHTPAASVNRNFRDADPLARCAVAEPAS